MKKVLFISCLGFFQLLFCQQKDKVYILFDLKSNQTCEVYKDGGGLTKQRKFQIIHQRDGDIDFYVCKELFTLKKGLKPDTLSINFLKDIKFSETENLKKIVDEVNPFYPFKVFKKVYLVEIINKTSLIRYDVKWQYYIE